MTSTQVRPDDLVRAKIDEQVRALVEHEQLARAGVDPEGVHQMRVAVRRTRAALKASHLAEAEELQAELKWLGSSLGDDCVVEAGLYVTAGTKVTLPDGRVIKARDLSGRPGLLFRRNSTTGTVEVVPHTGAGVELNAALHAND